ncbi:glycosyltransferase [Shewanella algae]|uniref:glycosyltransferase n=1 Tax=Shewanella algae TaxID=38313 RepID=UPI000569E396|nr:glycosyltransferase [Shewanella algae]MCM2528631.1 glycosyltransferase [Shewanella algae]NKZ42150.1 glycosyltransferase family 4 protein [Shewanella algae]QTE79403.1 glycosyltransferase family 4 protein [Shewanella algae]HDS1200612.1 glycosyltransferase family 4 protein [Shewanella algae]
MYNSLTHYFNYIRPGGGPAGYLFNLNEIACDSEEVKVFFNRVEVNSQSKKIDSTNRLYYGLIMVLKSIFRRFGRLSPGFYESLSNESMPIFHSVTDAVKFSRFRKDFLLMIHSPKEPSKEILDAVEQAGYSKIFQRIYEYFLKREERKAINCAYALILPDLGSMDAYYKNDETLKTLLAKKRKYIVPTGVRQLYSSKVKSEIRKELSLTSTDMVIGFFGRYNEDKGYDYFCELVESNLCSKIRFISAGIGPICPVSKSNYQDLGWRTDIQDLIKACDYVIVPNRVSYFDLIILEAYSLGVKVITTNIGGAKVLPKKATLFLDVNSDVKFDFQLMKMLESHPYSSDDILNVYNENYSLKAFLGNYNLLLKNINEEKNYIR